MKRFTLPAFAAAGISLFASPAGAAEIDVHGFLLGTASVRTSSVPLATGEKRSYLLTESRLRLDLNADSDSGKTAMVAKIDALADSVSSNTSLEVRELYGEYLSDSFELRLGRQMATWGVADRLFINDVFPKNWSAFYSGQPLEYMKIGSDMVKTSVFGDGWDTEIALIPVAQYDVVPGTTRYQLAGNQMLPVQAREKRLSGGEAAIRLHTAVGNTDIALYAFKGFWHQPDKGYTMVTANITATNPTGMTTIYPRLNSFGATVQDTLLGGVLSLETGYYDSIDDKAGTDPFIANSQYRYLVGYEHDIWTDITLGLQLYGEIMKNYTAYYNAAQAAFLAGTGPKPVARHRKIGTVNIRSLWMNQTLTASLFAMGVAGGGRMAVPDLYYAVTDEFSVNLGAHVFWGGPNSWMLGMMKNDDNVYTNAKWTF